MSSFELNKVAGAILLAGIIAMVLGIISDNLVKPTLLAKNVYVVQGVETAAAPASAAPEQLPPVAPLLASASLQHGESLVKVCAACHTMDKGKPPSVGPNLYGVVGGPHAHEQGYSYSPAMTKLHDEPWSYEALNEFLAHPQQTIKGTKMTFAGLPKPQDRADVVVYLRSLSDNPQPLP